VNYRHAFHAGNFADVVKHLILSRIVAYLKLKTAAFRVIDTHAGAGTYDLTGDEARRSPEWLDGIKRLLDADLDGEAADLAAAYLDVVRTANPAAALTSYPGSPVLIRQLLRPQDRLTAIELHPEDAATLRGFSPATSRPGSSHSTAGWRSALMSRPRRSGDWLSSTRPSRRRVSGSGWPRGS